jgi:hypothetical protein
LILGLGLAAAPLLAQPASEDWRPFTGTWTLSGKRQTLPTEKVRDASIVQLSGALLITGPGDLGRGLLGKVIGFDDGGLLMAGRVLFTDAHGDRIFCVLKAEPLDVGRKATVTITGGTGRYADLEGAFTFVWQYVVSDGKEDLNIRAVQVEGRTRHSQASHREVLR